MSITLDAEFCIEGLEEEALARHGKQAIFDTDKGSQFTSTAFTAVLLREKMAIKYGEVYLNAYALVPRPAPASVGTLRSTMPSGRILSMAVVHPTRYTYHQPLLAAAIHFFNLRVCADQPSHPSALR